MRPTRAAALLALLLAACGAGGAASTSGAPGPTGPTGPTGPVVPGLPVLVASGQAGACRVEVRSDRELGTGIATLGVVLAGAGGAGVPDATVTVSAARPATGTPAPIVAAPARGADGVFRVDAAFVEASPATGGWRLEVRVFRPGRPAEVATFDGIPVVERNLAAVLPVEGGRVLVATRFASGLQVGSNPIALSLHEVPGGDGVAAPVVDAAIHAEPWMPSMGHGSAGSVDPVATGTAGVYEGALVFSMPGDWETTLAISRGGAEIGRAAIRVFF